MQIPEGLPSEGGTFTARDGTVLAYWRIGTGTPLVVCHGSFSTARDWVPFAAELAGAHAVYVYDRRGRGASPRAGDFAIDAEVDDLAAMIEIAGPGAAIVGHSFGGGCALSFAARGGFAGPLALYEPRHALRGPVSRGHIPELAALLAEGDREAALLYALRAIVGAPDAGVAAFRASPLWGPMCDTVAAFPNELRLLDTLCWQPGDLDPIRGPVTLLVGEQSPVLPDETSPDAALRALLPRMRTVAVPGQGHFAFAAAPALLAEMVGRCLEEPA